MCDHEVVRWGEHTEGAEEEAREVILPFFRFLTSSSVGLHSILRFSLLPSLPL